MPDFTIENALYSDGFSPVCGVDEAGRGPLAGPVFAAAVILPRDAKIAGLDDSKKLSPKKREQLFDAIVRTAVSFAIATADVREINELNILAATQLAMTRAIRALDLPPSVAIIDGNYAKDIGYPNLCVVKGDEKSCSVAAASILAKVSRDRHMVALAEQYPNYGFERHKGYGTQFHRDAITAFGATPEHRTKFIQKIIQGIK